MAPIAGDERARGDSGMADLWAYIVRTRRTNRTARSHGPDMPHRAYLRLWRAGLQAEALDDGFVLPIKVLST